MEDYNFYQVQGWMVNNLNLKGNELICYAVIYSFSQDEESKFMGGVKYLCGWLNASEPTVISVLEKLVAKGLIEPIPVITKTCKRVYYQVTKDSLVRGYLRNLSKGTKDSLGTLYNNNNNNIDNNKEKRDNNKLSSLKKPDIDFDEFYKLYPLKKSKQCAIKVWNKLSVEDKKEAIEKLPAYIADCYENKRSFKYPSTYLSQRTWEDDFTSSEEEKEEPTEETQYPAGMDAEQWNEITFWMCNKVPKIAGKINPVTFDTMKKMAKDSQLLSMVLKEVDYRFTLDSSLDVMEVFKEELKNYWDEQTD